MSYFIAGYQTDNKRFINLESAFRDIVPEILINHNFGHVADKSYLSIYGTKKAIRDVFINDNNTGSWIIFIGTPLIDINIEKENINFLNDFFSNPKNVIREKIDGCWCLFGYDAIRDKFYACTDCNNTTPIFYAQMENGFFFSSHELALGRFLGGPIDPLGFSMTINLMLTWDSYTRFSNIKKLLPAQIVVFKGPDLISSERYWTASEESQRKSEFDDIVQDWLKILKKSVNSYYKASQNRTVLCDITGGEDSRLVLSAVHNLKLPFIGTVDGSDDHDDVIVAKKISKTGGFELMIRPKPVISQTALLEKATDICLFEDGYRDYISSCTDYAMYLLTPLINYDYVKYCADPGGEIFRGSYYLRGKAIFPSSMKNIDYMFFTKMKFLLDFFPGLLRFPDEELKRTIFNLVKKALSEVEDFPLGTKIDHLLRVFQVCNMGLIYKLPRYKPLASMELTKSVYNIPPKSKKGSKLTRACTEILYPEIAYVKTQKGIPTIKKNIFRVQYFLPEYIWIIKSITSGTFTRLLKWKGSNKLNLNWERNSGIIRTLLTSPPYSKWFASPNSMITGNLYNTKCLDSLLNEAKESKTHFVYTLGRIISQEIAMRWVYKEK